MEFTKTQKKEAFNKLPQETKEFIFSEEFTNAVIAIGKTHSLLIDKIDTLESEILAVLLGLNPAYRMIENIQNHLGVPSEKATAIAKNINQQIFLKIRENLQNAVHETINETEDVEMERDALLKEIENPTPTRHPISSVDQTIAGPAIPHEITPPTKESVAHDFISGKLTETVSLPPQKKTYNLDPYREPLA